MPEAVDYVVGKLLGNGGITIPEWPFICLLWAIPLYCSHLANNTDILLAYYLNGNVDTASLDVMSDSSIQDGNVRKTTSFNNRSQRSNLTYTLRPRPLRSAIAL
ncbi:uncharacterized protein LOC129001763 [Macrosteles quadrilineatus]|uniref:uncharacterized protein LOC129001763 n=1 Tax=Macrosteles quadrilineatus TaxID=74068 RepID=UPI0023E1940F|nr:uncharacterized protein LOC129001763 [Macrosteles quadrilineatus]